jgi:hypothetical protein
MGGSCSSYGKNEKYLQNLVGKSEKIPRRRCEDNIKIYLREIGCQGAEWIHQIQGSVQLCLLVNTVMNLWVSSLAELLLSAGRLCSMELLKCELTYLLTYLLITWCRILFEKPIVTQPVKKYPAFFMEPEGSLACPQKSAIGPYPEPAESNCMNYFIPISLHIHNTRNVKTWNL